jgi:hypothetical protein
MLAIRYAGSAHQVSILIHALRKRSYWDNYAAVPTMVLRLVPNGDSQAMPLF